MKQLLRHQGLLLLACGLVFFVALNGAGLFNESEAKIAASSAEMYRGKARIVPKFNDALNTETPIFVYWAQMIGYRLLGINETAARLPSALFATLTVLLTYHLGRKLYSSDIGFLAGIIICTFLFFAAAGRLATPDLMQIFFVELFMTSYVWIVTRRRGSSFCRGSVRVPGSNAVAAPSKSSPENNDENEEEEGEEERRPSLFVRMFVGLFSNFTATLVMYIPMGLAVLVAGPIGAILPSIVLLVFALISIRYDDLQDQILKEPEGPKVVRWIIALAQAFRPRAVLKALHEIHLIEGLIVAGVVAIPWYFLVGVSTSGAWLHGFFFDHQLKTYFGIKEGHSGFPFYFLYDAVMVLVGCFPWSVFLPVALNRLYERLVDGAAWRESDRLIACWISVWFLFFLFVGTKSVSSTLPIYPALALVLARYFFDWKRANVDTGVYSFNVCCRAMLVAGIVFALGISLMAFLYFPQSQWTGLIGFVPVIGALIARRYMNLENRPLIIRTLNTSAFIFVILMVVVLPIQLRSYQDTLLFVDEAMQIAKADDVTFATYEYFDPSLVFYTGKPVRQLNTSRKVADFLVSHPHAFVIAKSSRFNDLRNDLTGGFGELKRHKHFLKGHDLTLVGRY